MPGGPTSAAVAVDIGLPADDSRRIVKALIEDDRGTLWVGTSGGLYAPRADGSVVRVEGATPAGDDVRALAIDGSGRLWAGTRDGLVAVDRSAARVERVYREPDGVLDSNIHALDASGPTVWSASVAGVAEVDQDPVRG